MVFFLFIFFLIGFLCSRTYQWLLDQKLETWPYEDKMTYVFSRQSWEDKANIKFAHPSNLTSFVKELQGEIWLVGAIVT
ncbi:hypothetical protein N568_0112120 [Lactococcus garvieae TRF1]|uniref:Uncharacterized protein n=1 Tax=Lactococcus garvieae TRF1 TaxID=1380772 RepID=V8AM33_9LACT|nr:hypothetical protein N568_0112120 [Lactococcus garvieae TRF1]